MKEIDNKSESLKAQKLWIQGDMQRCCIQKMLFQENVQVIKKKISAMSTEELNAKIIKVAQAFNFIYSFKYIQYIEMNVYEMKKNLQKLLNTIAQACQMQQELEVFQRTQEIKDSALQGNNKKIRKSYCKIRGIDGSAKI
eukprot:TRINITY_DN1195_c0_g1_i12.p6 TRINITY_DN1195_c0_g1~~TRINITY_DN1195_c0_g1_i12.p6  ORF type:complete len:140 (+),score=15.53 TRINITY_DN1195_c0_g1_i12:851-1270(+)